MARRRSSSDDLLDLAIADLAGVLTDAGVGVGEVRDGSLAVALDGIAIELDVVPVAYATRGRVEEVLEGSQGLEHPVLVADRITTDARDLLSGAGWGWLDRRGRLRLRAPGLLIDTAVEAAPRGSGAPREPIRGRAGLAVAYRLLTENRHEPVSPTRSDLPFAPSTISEALSRLRDSGLVDRTGAPLLPELFWAVAEHWKPERVWLATEPSIRETSDQGLDGPGWCVAGTVAAADWEAPLVSTSGTPPDLYLPGPAAVMIATRRYGAAPDAQVAAASIAVAPVADVTSRRFKPRSQVWPLAHPVAVALDLAQDKARGREALDDWDPPERVW